MTSKPKSTVIIFDPASDSIQTRLPAHIVEWRDGILWQLRTDGDVPVINGKASTPEALATWKRKPDAWDSIPGLVLIRRGANPDGRIVEEEDVFDATPEGRAYWQRIRDRMEAEREAEMRQGRIYLSSRGWGDFSPVEWVGDITRPAAEIEAECASRLAEANDVDTPLGTEEIAAKVAEAKAAYADKIEAARQRAEARRRDEEERAAAMRQVERWERRPVDGNRRAWRHTVRVAGRDIRLVERNVPDFGRVVNPDYAVAPGREPGGLAMPLDAGQTGPLAHYDAGRAASSKLGWADYSDGAWRIVRPLDAEEEVAFAVVSRWGATAGEGIIMEE